MAAKPRPAPKTAPLKRHASPRPNRYDLTLKHRQQITVCYRPTRSPKVLTFYIKPGQCFVIKAQAAPMGSSKSPDRKL